MVEHKTAYIKHTPPSVLHTTCCVFEFQQDSSAVRRCSLDSLEMLSARPLPSDAATIADDQYVVLCTEPKATLASRHTAVCTDAHICIGHARSILLGVLRAYFSAASTRSMRVLTAKRSTAHSPMAVKYPQGIASDYANIGGTFPKYCTASTGSTCSVEPRNTRSSGSINMQNPKYCEYTRSMGSIEH